MTRNDSERRALSFQNYNDLRDEAARRHRVGDRLNFLIPNDDPNRPTTL